LGVAHVALRTTQRDAGHDASLTSNRAVIAFASVTRCIATVQTPGSA
jgi:hypothetical protein